MIVSYPHISRLRPCGAWSTELFLTETLKMDFYFQLDEVMHRTLRFLIAEKMKRHSFYWKIKKKVFTHTFVNKGICTNLLKHKSVRKYKKPRASPKGIRRAALGIMALGLYKIKGKGGSFTNACREMRRPMSFAAHRRRSCLWAPYTGVRYGLFLSKLNISHSSHPCISLFLISSKCSK